jgi:hypothetical protein
MRKLSDVRVSRRGRIDAVTGAFLSALLLGGWDLKRIVTTAPDTALDWRGALGFLVIGVASCGLCLLVPLVTRAGLTRVCSRGGAAGAALLGVLEALTLVVFCIQLSDPRSMSADLRMYVAVVILVGLVGVRWLWCSYGARVNDLARLSLGGGLLVVASVLLATLRWNGSDAFRFGLQLIFAVGVMELLCALPPLSRAARVASPVLALAIVAGSSPLLATSAAARYALHHESSHLRASISALGWLADRDGDGAAPLFAGRDCDPQRRDVFPGAAERAGDRVDGNCSGGDGTSAAPPASSALAGAARGRDVLLLSIDSLRWDALAELEVLRAALGPHLAFERAVSPAPATKESLASTLRGRAVRRLRFETAQHARGTLLWRDPSPTLAHVLVNAGYRAVTVPTSHVGDPRTGVQSGFDSVWAANYDARHKQPARSPYAHGYVPADEVLAVAMDAARATKGPLCVWAHLMEPHAPYTVREPGSCDRSVAGDCFRAAVRDTAQRLAGLVRDFTRVRGRAPIVAVFGDHGEEFGEHGGDFHASSVHAEQVRVALLLAADGVLPAGQVDAPVSLAALPATLLELLGIDVPRSMTESSLLGPIAGQAAWPELAVSELPAGARRLVAYTGRRYRYLNDPVHAVELLFDMQEDPYERRDLSEEEPDALASMRSLARAWDEAERVRVKPLPLSAAVPRPSAGATD